MAKGQYDFVDCTVEEAFKNFYIVPDYQREYVWEAEKQVAQLIQDVFDAYTADSKQEYFIGTTIVYRNDGRYELIDGQQRTTTLFLALCAFRQMFRENLDALESVIRDCISHSRLDDNGNTFNEYKLTLQYSDSSNVIENVANNTRLLMNKTKSATRILAAYDYIYRQVIDLNADDFDEIKRFFMYFFRKLKFIQIITPGINSALKIFETINDRGVGLNPMDLLKNLMFQNVPREDFNKLNLRWKELTNILENNNEKPLRFLRYFLAANYPGQANSDRSWDNQKKLLSEDEIYTWINSHEEECGYAKNPYGFVDLLISNATAYVKYAQGQNIDGSRNVYLENISRVGGTAFRQHLMLLLAARKHSQEMFDYLARNLEVLIYYVLFMRIQAKYFERNFYLWTVPLSQVKTMEELQQFVETYIKPEVKKLEPEYQTRFSFFAEDDLQVYRLRYIMARLAQFIDQSKIGSHTPSSLDAYYNKVEIEHILPQKPTEEILAAFDGEDYNKTKSMFGNLTLLEQPINTSIHNDTYQEKAKAYKSSKIYLTSSLAALDSVGNNTAINRTNEYLKSFEEWNSQTIQERQTMLCKISMEVWKIE